MSFLLQAMAHEKSCALDAAETAGAETAGAASGASLVKVPRLAVLATFERLAGCVLSPGLLKAAPGRDARTAKLGLLLSHLPGVVPEALAPICLLCSPQRLPCSPQRPFRPAT